MYKIKSKIVDGKIVYGIIDENLTVLVEFKYKEISPVEGIPNVFLLKSENNKISVFMDNMIIGTKYKELIFIPCEICGYNNMFIGKTSRKAELFSIHKKYNEDKLEVHVFKPTDIFGKDSDVKIDDIKIEEDGVCLYSKTEEGLLKGYFGHKILGNLKPEYVDVKSYSYSSPKPYIPKFNKECYYTTQFEKDWSSRYAIVTKRVNGELKKGIIIRKKSEYGDKWEELIPPKYDDIIPNDNGDFTTINYKNGKPQNGLIHMTTYYDMYSKGACIYGCASLQKEFEIESEFDEILRLIKVKAQYVGENDYIYYIVKKNDKYGLYKSRTRDARGDYDHCNNYNQHPDGPLLEKMLDCEYDSITPMLSKLGLKNYERKHFVESFKATKGENSLLVFDQKDANFEYVKTECEYKDIKIYRDDYYTCYIGEDREGFKQFVSFESIPKTNAYQISKYQLKLSPKYKKAYMTKTRSSHLLIGEYEDGKVDVLNRKLDQICSHTDSFKIEDYFCISKKKIENEGTVVKYLSVYNKSCELIHEFKGSEINYSYSEKTNSIYVSIDGRVYIVDLNRSTVIDGVFNYIEIFEDFMIYEQASGCGLNRLTNDGVVSILEPIYESVQILNDINRIIVEKKDKDGKIKYGVVESNKGNNCIDIIYDSVTFDRDNNRFCCTLGDKTLYFDIDGFAIENQVSLNLNPKNS